MKKFFVIVTVSLFLGALCAPVYTVMAQQPKKEVQTSCCKKDADAKGCTEAQKKACAEADKKTDTKKDTKKTDKKKK